MVTLLLWFGYEVPLEKRHGVKDWTSAGTLIEEWLYHECTNLINGLIHTWVHTWMEFYELVYSWRKWMGVCLWKLYLVFNSFSLMLHFCY
jgi:hypothetical protein